MRSPPAIKPDTSLGKRWLGSTVTLTQLATGDEIAWSQLDARARPVLVAYLLRRGCTTANAEDIAQTAMAALSRTLSGSEFGSQPSAVSGFLFTVVKRELSRQRRRDWNLAEQPVEHTGEYWGTRVADHEARRLWDDTWLVHTQQHCLAQLQACSSALEFEAFELRIRREMKVSAIAECLGVETLEVSRMVYRARKRLAAIMERLRRDEEWLHEGRLPVR